MTGRRRDPGPAVLNALAAWQPGCTCYFTTAPWGATILVWDDCPVCPEPPRRRRHHQSHN